MALVRILEPAHDDRLHRPAPHSDRVWKFPEQGGRWIESKPDAHAQRPHTGPQQEGGRLDRAPRGDDGPRPNVDGEFATVAPEGRLDASCLAAFNHDAIGLRVEEEPSSCAVGVGQICDEGGPLRIVYAPEEAEVASVRAAKRVPRNHVVIDAEAVAKGFAAATQNVVRRIDGALVDVHMKSVPNLVDERVECGRGHSGQAALRVPFLPGPSRWLEARHPVDRRAAARGLAGEDAERRVS